MATQDPDRAARSRVCRHHAKAYGRIFRELHDNCTITLKRALRSPGTPLGAIYFCQGAIEKASKNINALESVKNCIRQGFAHGILQPWGRRKRRRD